MAGIPTTPVPAVRVLWRPEQFNRVTNPGFETNTTGWSASSGINAAATSITRITTDSHGGSASASVVTTAATGSGVNFDLGSDRYFLEASYGAIYLATAWVKWVSGSTTIKIILGSEGTSSDRATFSLEDALASWQPITVRWLPTANRTDAQLAFTTGTDEISTFLVDDVAVYLVDAFSQLENGTFEVDTTGWSSFRGGTVTRSATDPFGGTYCATVASGVGTGGASWAFASRTWPGGRTYRVRLAARLSSGAATPWRVDIEDGSTAYYTDITPTAEWAWYTFDWTPASDQTSYTFYLFETTGVDRTIAIDEVEVYEAIDDLGTDAETARWTRVPGQVGSIHVEVGNADSKYDPRYASGSLYGLLMPGKRMWGRATYDGALYPLFHGTLKTIETRKWEGRADLLGEDTWADFVRHDASIWMDPDATYAGSRSLAVAAVVSHDPDTTTSTVGGSRCDLSNVSIEGNMFYAITDGEDSAASYLSELDDATQSVSWCAPSVHANIGWRYTAVDRGTLTDDSSDFTVDEDFESLDGVRVTDEALENRQAIPWQGYEVLAPPGATAGAGGNGIIATSEDPDYFSGTAYANYLDFTRDDYGTDDDHPEPRWRYPRGWSRKRWNRRRRKGHVVPRRTRIFPDAITPTYLDAGESKTFTIETSIPMSDMSVTIDHEPGSGGGGGTMSVTSYSQDRFSFTFTVTAETDTAILSGVYIWGTPYLPLADSDAVVDDLDSQAILGVHPGPSMSTPYIPSLGAAQGVGAYRNWRYSRPRMRPTLGDFNTFPRVLTADVTDHLTVSADRWNIDAVLFVSTGCRWEVTDGGLQWRSWHDLEELPTHTDWFTLDSSALDGTDVLAY